MYDNAENLEKPYRQRVNSTNYWLLRFAIGADWILIFLTITRLYHRATNTSHRIGALHDSAQRNKSSTFPVLSPFRNVHTFDRILLNFVFRSGRSIVRQRFAIAIFCWSSVTCAGSITKLTRRDCQTRGLDSWPAIKCRSCDADELWKAHPEIHAACTNKCMHLDLWEGECVGGADRDVGVKFSRVQLSAWSCFVWMVNPERTSMLNEGIIHTWISEIFIYWINSTLRNKCGKLIPWWKCIEDDATVMENV